MAMNSVDVFLKEFFVSADWVTAYLRWKLIAKHSGPVLIVDQSDLFQAYTRWCKENRHTIYKSTTTKQKLFGSGVEPAQVRLKGKPHRCYALDFKSVARSFKKRYEIDIPVWNCFSHPKDFMDMCRDA
jgi:phage/plasmid-associated DNA primase